MAKAMKYLDGFGPFRLDPSERLLLREDEPVCLTSKAFDVLLMLLERAGHLVPKADLKNAVWPDCFVEDGNLAVTISMLRKALRDDERAYIATVAGQGYRFVYEVCQVVKPETEAEPLAGPPPVKPSLPMPETLPEPPEARRPSHWHPVPFLLASLAIVVLAGLFLLSHRRVPVLLAADPQPCGSAISKCQPGSGEGFAARRDGGIPHYWSSGNRTTRRTAHYRGTGAGHIKDRGSGHWPCPESGRCFVR